MTDTDDRGAADLEERQLLGRVEGIRTDLDDIHEVEYRQLRLERVVLVGIDEDGRTFAELEQLATTAGSRVLGQLSQSRNAPDPATYLGSGKVEELARLVADVQADTVICDGELTGAQLRNLEDRTKVKVVDRTTLILDIFAQHAKSTEGKAQIELAQLTYLRQRLRGWGASLSRQVGGRAASGAGIGGRGPGETKIETDRRRIGKRIARLRAELKGLKANRLVRRSQRLRRKIPSVVIVGYTNAGKSSLLNRLTQAGVLVDNSLFATLDPTTRRAHTATGREFTLTDTVGFIRRLPTDLIEAFASTLEEATDADLLLHVVDASDPDPAGQVAAVREVLAGIDAASVPEQLVLNKTDLVDEAVWTSLRTQFPEAVFVSVRTGAGIDELVEVLARRLPELDTLVEALLPYDRGDLLDRLHKTGRVESVDHTPDGTRVVARVGPELRAGLEPYMLLD